MPTTAIDCPYRTNGTGDTPPLCQIVAEITARPLVECHVNDSACTACLAHRLPPQAPNPITASMSIAVAHRSGDPQFMREMLAQMRPHLNQVKPTPPATVENTPCIKRGVVLKQIECKPCNAGAGGIMVDVFGCPEFGQCTLSNTGTTPKIQGCVTCPPDKRLEKSYRVDHVKNPPEVLSAIAAGGIQGNRRGGR